MAAHLHLQELANLSDEALLAYALEQPHAFELLVDRYQKDFLKRAQYVLKNREDAEDVVQDTFVRIYRFGPRFRETRGTFKSWALTVLLNTARSRYQQNVRDWKRVAPLAPEHYETLAAPSERESVDSKDIIERAISLVGQETAELLRHAFIEEMPYEDIAKKLGVRVGTVKTRIHRAKKSLRALIGSLE